jgi:hypothetical protein
MGGSGTSRANKGFTSDYDLPNESAYAETYAAIGLIFWVPRMLQLENIGAMPIFSSWRCITRCCAATIAATAR